MNTLSTLERRAFSRLTTPAGRMLVVAADQRNGMKAVMNGAEGPEGISVEELAEAKSDLVAHLGNHAPAILLDPEVALPKVVDEGTLAAGTALVVGMDASGFETVDGLRYTRYVPGVTAATVRELGGDAAKMLWYLRPDQPASVERVAAEMEALVATARRPASCSSSRSSPTGSRTSRRRSMPRASASWSSTPRGSRWSTAPRCSSWPTRARRRPAPR